MDLPFELYKYHKRFTKYNWKRHGLITDNFEEIYERYIYCKECDLCGKVFPNTKDRHMEHCHETGEFRNIVCSSCNQRKSDVKIRTHNTSGYKHICKHKGKDYKQGFIWQFQVRIDGKRKTIKQSVNLDKLVEFRDKWFEEHPEYHT